MLRPLPSALLLSAALVSSFARADVVDATALPPVVLGAGVETTVGGVRGDCLSGAVGEEGDYQSRLLVDAPVTLAELEADLSPQSAASTGPWLPDAATGLLFLDNARPKETSLALVFGYTVRGKRLRFAAGTPSALGARMAAAPATARRAACGDAALTAVEVGASLYVALRFDFESSADKDRYSRDFDLPRASFANVSAKIRRIVEMSRGHVAVTLAAFQRGGDPTQLVRIFGDAAGDIPILRCSLTRPDQCAAATEAVRTYVVDPTRGFRAQLDLASGTNARGGPRPIAFETTPYAALRGASSLASPSEDGPLRAAAAEQARVRAEILPREARARELRRRAAAAGLTEPEAAEAKALAFDLQVLRAAHARCADVPSTCAAATADALTSLSRTDSR